MPQVAASISGCHNFRAIAFRISDPGRSRRSFQSAMRVPPGPSNLGTGEEIFLLGNHSPLPNKVCLPNNKLVSPKGCIPLPVNPTQP